MSVSFDFPEDIEPQAVSEYLRKAFPGTCVANALLPSLCADLRSQKEMLNLSLGERFDPRDMLRRWGITNCLQSSFNVVRVCRDGRCLFSCIAVARLEPPDQHLWMNRNRNEINACISPSTGFLNATMAKFELSCAQWAAAPYIEWLEREGRAGEVSAYRAGTTHVEGSRTLKEIAEATGVRLEVYHLPHGQVPLMFC